MNEEKLKEEFTIAEIAESINLMRKRYEQGQGRYADAMCRLSLPMSEYLLSEIVALLTQEEQS